MDFPLEELVKFDSNIYEITCASSRRAYQLSVLKNDFYDSGNEGKLVSLAARQLFTHKVEYRLEN